MTGIELISAERAICVWNANGATRYVSLIGRWAFKIPSLHSWRNFLWGLLANIQEVNFWESGIGVGKLCPVLFHLPLGFLVVMPRCRILSAAEFKGFQYEAFVDCGDWRVPVEAKPDSFGWLKRSVVAVDYGS